MPVASPSTSVRSQSFRSALMTGGTSRSARLEAEKASPGTGLSRRRRAASSVATSCHLGPISTGQRVGSHGACTRVTARSGEAPRGQAPGAVFLAGSHARSVLGRQAPTGFFGSILDASEEAVETSRGPGPGCGLFALRPRSQRLGGQAPPWAVQPRLCQRKELFGPAQNGLRLTGYALSPRR